VRLDWARNRPRNGVGFRAVTGRLFRPDEPPRPDDADQYLPAVELTCRPAEG
jgi:hypothetical protein